MRCDYSIIYLLFFILDGSCGDRCVNRMVSLLSHVTVLSIYVFHPKNGFVSSKTWLRM